MPHRNSRYVPLTEDEQEVLSRLVDEDRELYVEVSGWGYHPDPKITWGDKRLQIQFPFEFTRPDFWVQINSLQLQLKLRDGTVLVDDTLSVTAPDGSPLRIREGTQLNMVWDIMVNRIGEKLRKRIMPQLKGRTIMRTTSDGVEKIEEDA